VVSFPHVFPLNPVCNSLLPHTRHMLYPPHPHLLEHSNNILLALQITMLFITQFSPVFSSFLIDINAFLSTLLSNTIGLYSSLNVRDQVLHPYKITGKIIVLYRGADKSLARPTSRCILFDG